MARSLALVRDNADRPAVGNPLIGSLRRKYALACERELVAREELDLPLFFLHAVRLDQTGLVHHAPEHVDRTAVGDQTLEVERLPRRGFQLHKETLAIRVLGEVCRGSCREDDLAFGGLNQAAVFDV